MNNKNLDYYIKKVADNICNIYNAFYIWKSLQNSKYNEIYRENNYFWGIIISSLENNWALDIAKLFDNSKKKGEEVIAIPFLLDFISEGETKENIKNLINEQKSTIDNLWKWRCKILAHQDKVAAEGPKNFYKRYPIKGVDIEKLLTVIKDILGMIKSFTSADTEYLFEVIMNESERDSKDIIGKLQMDSKNTRSIK